MKVMLVEDDELVRATLVDGLEDAGIQVAEFSDPEKALSPPETVDPPDVVITDIDLGSKLNGFDVAAAVHHRWPSVRVLLISGLPAGHTGQRLDPRDGIYRNLSPIGVCYARSMSWRRRPKANCSPPVAQDRCSGVIAGR